VAVVFGIDISHFQHGLSLAAVKAQGYEFVIAKATQGQGVQDPDFHAFREEAQSLGLLFAAYHFLHSDSSAGAQADNLAEHLNGETNIPVMIDCEPTKGSSPSLANVNKFIAACERRDLRVTILYLPRFHWQALGRPALHAGLPPVMQAL
jgi:lysozyme